MKPSLSLSLAGLTGQIVTVLPSDETRDEGSVLLQFSDGCLLRADYWRLFKDKKACLSSFDHRQKYGLPKAINAIQELQTLLQERHLVQARMDVESGDLIFEFDPSSRLHAFNFTGYEVWEITFPNGTAEYSNRNPPNADLIPSQSTGGWPEFFAARDEHPFPDDFLADRGHRRPGSAADPMAAIRND